MFRYLSISLVLAAFTAGGTLGAPSLVNMPQPPEAVRASTADLTWTNEDLEQLSRVPGLISVVGQPINEAPQDADEPVPQVMTEDPAWYAAQADKLRSQLEAEQADLQGFLQALEDARELRSQPAGINLDAADVGISPEATIDTLQNRIDDTQGQLDDLEDLARKNNIPPGVLRD